MKDAIKAMSDPQISFICKECDLSKDDLFDLSDEDLYSKVFDVMCDIETDEACEHDEETERCAMASGIVTALSAALQ